MCEHKRCEWMDVWGGWMIMHAQGSSVAVFPLLPDHVQLKHYASMLMHQQLAMASCTAEAIASQ